MLLGIDLGTTTIKAILLETDGSMAASAGMEYESLSPQPGWVEQDPQVWLETIIGVVQSLWKENPLSAGQVTALGLTGQMHGAVFLSGDGHPLRPAIIWADGRSREQVNRVVRELGQDEITRLIGNPLFPGFMLPSLLWVRENEPDTWHACKKVLLPKDYVRLLFTGEYGSEPSDASSTALFDPARRVWSDVLCRRLNIDGGLLAPVYESHQIAGGLRPEMAGVLGLSAGIPVAHGGSDQACQALGSGIIKAGDVSCTIGTGGQIFAPIAQPQPDPLQRLHLFCHAVPGMWHLEAATLSAGLSLRWLRNLIGSCTYQQLAGLAAGVEPGAEGLLFAPFLQGERTPYMDANLRGGFTGLSVRHGLPHLARAVMEGVVFSQRSGLEIIRKKTVDFIQIAASGGAVRHPLWLKIMADIFQMPVVTVQTPEAAAAGAAMLAGIGSGVFADAEDAVGKVCRYSEPILPDPHAAERYDRIYEDYLGLYERLK